MNVHRMKAAIKDYLQSPSKIALSLALVFGILSAVLVPQMSVNDEGAHFLKSYSLTTGQLSGQSCVFPEDILDRAARISQHGLTSVDSEPVNYSNTKSTTCGSAGNYSPIMHLPQATGISIGKLLGGSADILVLFGRISNAIFYALALFFVIRFARHIKWAYVVIGLFPLMIHTAGSLSGDVVNNVLVMATLAFIFNLVTQKSRITKKQIIAMVVLAGLLALTKATNIILLLPLVAIPARLFKQDVFPKMPFNVRKWIFIALCGIVALTVFIIAQKLLGSALFFREPVDNPLATDPLRFISIVFNTYINPTIGYGDLLVRGLVGEFSSFKYHLPTALVFIQLALLIFTLAYKQPDEPAAAPSTSKVLAITCMITLAVFVAAITFALYSAWAILPNRLGTGAFYADGVQGRYFTAALLLLIPVALWLRRYVWLSMKSLKIYNVVIFATTTFCLIFYIVQTIWVFA